MVWHTKLMCQLKEFITIVVDGNIECIDCITV